jgi:hypothetical protein
LHGCQQFAEMEERCGVLGGDVHDGYVAMCLDAKRLDDRKALHALACAETTDDCDTYEACVYAPGR